MDRKMEHHSSMKNSVSCVIIFTSNGSLNQRSWGHQIKKKKWSLELKICKSRDATGWTRWRPRGTHIAVYVHGFPLALTGGALWIQAVQLKLGPEVFDRMSRTSSLPANEREPTTKINEICFTYYFCLLRSYGAWQPTCEPYATRICYRPESERRRCLPSQPRQTAIVNNEMVCKSPPPKYHGSRCKHQV